MHKVLALTLSLGAAFAATSASAGSLTVSTILNDFNAVIYTNASTPSDVEGAIVVGGNFSGATVYNNPGSVTQPTGFGAVTTFGYTYGNSININNGGSAYVGGNEGAQINFNGGGGYISAPPNTIADFETPMNALSQSLAQQAATGTLPAVANNEVITAIPGANGVAIIDLTAAQLAAISSFQINMNGASSLIFNVSGSSVSFNANDESGTSYANDIIWNFYQASSVSLGTQIGGTVLATAANVTNQNQIDGDLIANSWTGSGELHEYAFTGTLPSSGTVASSAPEPASVALFGSGLVALLAYARRRQRKI